MMMVSDVNLWSAPGTMPGAPTLTGESDRAEGASSFAALVDDATLAEIGHPAPATPSDPEAGIEVDPTVVPECRLADPDITAVFDQFCASAARSEDDAAADPGCGKSDEPPVSVEGVMNIEWLLARPPHVTSGAGGAPAAGASAEAAGDAEARGDATRLPEALTAGPDAAAARPHVPTAENPLRAAQAIEGIAQPRAELDAEPHQAASNLQAAPASKTVDGTIAKAPMPVVSESAREPMAAAMPPVPPSYDRAEERRQAVELASRRAEAQVDDVPRQSAAAARLSKAIERVGGVPTAASVVPGVPDTPGESSLADGDASDFSSSRHDGSAVAHVRPAPSASNATFAIPFADVHRATDVAVRAAETSSFSRVQVPEADTVRQLVQAMRMQFRDGIGNAVVRLKPEHLGEVSITLRVEQQSVSATVQAEVAGVRHWLESQEASLRQGLAEQGLHLDKFIVRRDGQQQQPDNQDEQARRRGQRTRRARDHEAEPKFEVTV